MSTILLIGDDEDNCRTVRDLVASIAYELIEAAAGEDGVTMMAIHHDLILMEVLDLVLPGLPGESLLERLASTDPDAAAFPIVVVTVKDLTASEAEALERLGAIAIFQKGSQAAIQAADTLAPLLGKSVATRRPVGPATQRRMRD